MNKQSLSHAAVLAALFLCINGAPSFARHYEDPPVIDIGSNNGENGGQKIPKAPVFRPILCEYHSETATLDFIFLANLGTAVITVTNYDTAQVWTLTTDTADGFAVVPVSGDSGYYHIQIQVSGSNTYSGSFTL